MPEEVRIGMVGGGWMCGVHVNAMRSASMIYGKSIGHPIFKTVADISPEAAASARAKFGFEHLSGSWRDVVNSSDIDLVDILTPNAFHYEIAKSALLSGKHVYCEKPLTLNAKQSRELADIAREKGLVNYVAYNNVVNPAVSYLKQLIKSGKLGKLIRFEGSYNQDMLLDPAIPISWRHKKSQAGSGALGDLGSHLLSISQYLMGDIEETAAILSVAIPSRPVPSDLSLTEKVETEDVISFLGRYTSGAICSISASRIAAGRKNSLTLEIQGTLGTAAFDLERLNEVHVYFHSDTPADRGFRKVLIGPEHGDYGKFQPAPGISIGYNDMKIIESSRVLSAVVSGEPYVCSFDFGARIDAAVHAILKSAESHNWEKLQA